jgi:hypothetical protein
MRYTPLKTVDRSYTGVATSAGLQTTDVPPLYEVDNDYNTLAAVVNGQAYPNRESEILVPGS